MAPVVNFLLLFRIQTHKFHLPLDTYMGIFIIIIIIPFGGPLFAHGHVFHNDSQ